MLFVAVEKRNYMAKANFKKCVLSLYLNAKGVMTVNVKWCLVPLSSCRMSKGMSKNKSQVVAKRS